MPPPGSPSPRTLSPSSPVSIPRWCATPLALALIPPAVAMVLGSPAQLGQWVYRALTFLVVSCPCALVISIPLTFFAGIGGASRAGVLVKGSNYLETLSDVNTVVFDKTGTLTRGVFEVTAVHHNTLAQERLLEYTALAESASSHPISKSLQTAYGKPLDRSRVADIQEISGEGVTAAVDGHSVACGNRKLMKRLGIDYRDCHNTGTIVHVAIDGAYAGHIVISDLLKPTAKPAMEALRHAGITKTVMLTGDIDAVAQATAKELGIDTVYSELLPGDKVSKVEELLEGKLRGKVAFVGDGINDAPVLSRADIGIAMGAMGSDAAMDAVLVDVPCSGLGIIRKKPDIRYRDLKENEALPALQKKILANQARYVKKGGVLLYSTCTLLPGENQEVVEDFLKTYPEFFPEKLPLPEIFPENATGMLTLLPGQWDTDGFFISKMRRCL